MLEKKKKYEITKNRGDALKNRLKFECEMSQTEPGTEANFLYCLCSTSMERFSDFTNVVHHYFLKPGWELNKL